MISKYIKPIIKIINIKKEDIIKTSGPEPAVEALFGAGKDGVKLS